MKRNFRKLLAAIPLIAAFAGALMAVGPAHAQQVFYKYLGPDGKMIYSDKPPPPGVKYEKLQTSTAPTGVSLAPRGTSAQEVDAAIQARQAKQAEQEQRVANLQKQYDDAVAALEAAKEPKEGERTQNANGTSRLNDDYFARVAGLQQRVDQAKEALDEARRE